MSLPNPEFASRVIREKLKASGEYTPTPEMKLARLTQSLKRDLTPFDSDELGLPLAEQVRTLALKVRSGVQRLLHH